MYCLYSAFFSFLTPYTLFPGTFVCFVLRNPEKPIIFRISIISGSSSTSIASVSLDVVTVEGALDAGTGGPVDEEGPFGFGAAEFELLESSFEFVGAGFWDRGPVGGAVADGLPLVLASGSGDLESLGFEGRRGERVRAPEGLSRTGDRDRERECVRGRSERRGGASSASKVPLATASGDHHEWWEVEAYLSVIDVCPYSSLPHVLASRRHHHLDVSYYPGFDPYDLHPYAASLWHPLTRFAPALSSPHSGFSTWTYDVSRHLCLGCGHGPLFAAHLVCPECPPWCLSERFSYRLSLACRARPGNPHVVPYHRPCAAERSCYPTLRSYRYT